MASENQGAHVMYSDGKTVIPFAVVMFAHVLAVSDDGKPTRIKVGMMVDGRATDIELFGSDFTLFFREFERYQLAKHGQLPWAPLPSASAPQSTKERMAEFASSEKAKRTPRKRAAKKAAS